MWMRAEALLWPKGFNKASSFSLFIPAPLYPVNLRKTSQAVCHRALAHTHLCQQTNTAECNI